MNEHDDGCMDEARETVRKRWLWRNQKAFSSPVKAALLGEVDEEEEEARLQRAVLRERERAAREEWEKKMKGDEGNRMKHPMAMLLQKREASADVTSPSTSTVSSTSSTQPREDKKKTKKGKKEEEPKESSLDSRKEKERKTKAAPTKTLSYNVNLHAQVRLRKVQSFVYSSDERSPTSTGLVSKEKRKSAAKKEKEKEKQEKKESKKKQKETKKKQKQKRVGKSKDDSFILRPTTVAGGRTTRSASDASAVTPRVLSMISKPLDEDDMVVVREGNKHHNALDCTQTVVLDADLAATAAATDFEERSRMLALHRAQQRATWVPPLDMAKLAPPTTTTTSSQVRSPYSTFWSSSQSSSSSSSCDISPSTSYSSTNLSSPSVRSAPTTPGSPTSSSSLLAGSKRSGVMEWLHLRRKRGESRGRSLPVRASRSESNSSSSSGLDANDEEAEDDQEATANATATTTTAAAATTAIAIKAKLAGGLSGRSRRRRGVKEDEERVLFPGSAMAFVRREARYAVGLP